MRGGRLIILVFLVFIVTLLATVSTFAQQDSDADGVLDEVDMCNSTNLEEGLPIAQNKEYLGCSCSQIQEKLGDYYCYDVLCSPNRPFSIRTRAYSSKPISCGQDYCINDVLYDFPNITQVPCVDGKEIEINCTATLKNNNQNCVNGSISQYVPSSEKESKNLGLLLLDDFEKLQKRAYNIATSDPRIKSKLGISNEQIFLDQSKKTMDAITIEKSIKTETKTVGNTERIIVTKTIKLHSENYKKINQLYIFEELPRGAKLIGSDIIPMPEAVLQEEGPVLVAWELESLDDIAEVSYQVNKRFEGETNTLLVAREVKDTTWRLMFIPLALIFLIIGIFIYVSEKSVPKRKKIFKER